MRHARTEPALPPESFDLLTPRHLADDHAGKLEYEWQFEIMNSLPRERAIALVHYLQHVEQERALASAAAKRLQQANRELERRLRSGPGAALWCCSRVLCLVVLVFPLLALLAAPYLGALGLEAPSARGIAAALPEGWAEGAEALEAALRSRGLSPWAGASCAAPLGVSADELRKLQVEHEAMSAQLSGMQADIDDAVHKGQDMVCWKV